MDESLQVRITLSRLRQSASKSQADVAERLSASASASRVSRLESGELRLTLDEAKDFAKAIGTPEAVEYAEYLGQTWTVLERPGFDHANRRSLWEAEQALQRLKSLQEDPDTKNILLKQVDSCRDALIRTARFLQNNEHSIALIGSPGVGKTTLICALANLRDESGAERDLEHQMVLQTGGGRTTICEVHVRYGGEYAIAVDPCTDEEMRQFVAEFCDHIEKLASDGGSGSAEAVGLNAEIDRALRNMTGLAQKRVKSDDGKPRREDPAKELAQKYPQKEDMQTQVFTRLELHRRRRTSVSWSPDTGLTGLQWLSRTFSKINYGHHGEFSLPRRIEVSLPERILGEPKTDLRLIDTRGVDEPKAPRRDLQGYLDDESAIIVFCSSFKDSPDAAMLDVIDRAIRGGLRESIPERALFVVLPQGGEESKVRDQQGQLAESVEDGRLIKLDQIRSTFARLGLPDMRAIFTNVTLSSDNEELRQQLLAAVSALRDKAANRIASLVGTVDHLIENRENESVQAALDEVARRVRVWCDSNGIIPDGEPHVEKELLTDMAGLRYASSLRASVNRRGDWYNFDYWHGLGFGSRGEAVARTGKQIAELKAVLKNLSEDPNLADAHGFLEHLATELEAAVNEFCQDIQSIGEAAYGDQLRADDAYWQRCRNRWGLGRGVYKLDIRQWTDDWFSEEQRAERRRFIESELQRRWRMVVDGIRSRVASATQLDVPAAV